MYFDGNVWKPEISGPSDRTNGGRVNITIHGEMVFLTDQYNGAPTTIYKATLERALADGVDPDKEWDEVRWSQLYARTFSHLSNVTIFGENVAVFDPNPLKPMDPPTGFKPNLNPTILTLECRPPGSKSVLLYEWGQFAKHLWRSNTYVSIIGLQNHTLLMIGYMRQNEAEPWKCKR